MNVAASEVAQLVQGLARVFVARRGHRQGDEHFVGVEPWVPAAKVLGFEGLDRLNGLASQKVDVVLDPGQNLERIQEHGRRASEEPRGFACDDLPVGQFDRGSRPARGLRFLQGGFDDDAVFLGQAQPPHDERNAPGDHRIGFRSPLIDQGLVVASNDFLLPRFAANGVVADAVARHVDAHVGGRLVRRFAGDFPKQCHQQRKHFDVAVVADHLLVVGLQVEGIDEVDVFKVGCGRLVGHIDRMAEGKVPNGECLELRISGLDPSAILVKEL